MTYIGCPSSNITKPLVRFYQGELGKAGENLEEGLQLAEKNSAKKSSQALGLIWQSYYNLNLGLNEAGVRTGRKRLCKLQQSWALRSIFIGAQFMLGTAYRHLKRTAEAIEVLETVHLHTQQMGLALDEVYDSVSTDQSSH